MKARFFFLFDRKPIQLEYGRGSLGKYLNPESVSAHSDLHHRLAFLEHIIFLRAAFKMGLSISSDKMHLSTPAWDPVRKGNAYSLLTASRKILPVSDFLQLFLVQNGLHSPTLFLITLTLGFQGNHQRFAHLHQ